jgi:arsenite methyltransferase
MLAKANENRLKSDSRNVEFIKSHITAIAIDSEISDCVISNCVINLVPESEKYLVFGEMFRILKSGGRLAVSDILAKKDLPPDMRKSVALYCGCIAGASQVGEYERFLTDAGFRGEGLQKI